MKNLIFFGLVILAISVFQFTGCFSLPQSNSQNSLPNASLVNKPVDIAEENFVKEWKKQYESTAAELEHNRRLWQENNIADYDFVIRKYAGGVTSVWNRLPVLIKVRNGEKYSIEKVEKNADYVYSSRTDGFESFDTIDKFFDFLRRELDGGNIMQVKYDEKYGYPKNVIITFTFSHGHNWRTIKVSKFEIIK